MMEPEALWIAETIYLYLPAYVANAVPVLFGGGAPLDGGRTWRDGRPLLGSHKTVRGLISGLIAGSAVGVIQMQPLRGILMSIGAVLGDLAVSFLKRRIGLRPGAPLPPADQLGFIAAAVCLSCLVPPAPGMERVAAILILTAPIHLATNIFAWLLGLKDEPW